ncbi:hypothetical protein BDV25DRAFT_143651 [Aspergillus avenaceus]|uniref:Enoyl reductase (ER) domain-containing protein n=1 Tax=Aspergillus avenaceus TaxID=36643 RepID=A0A5N6TK64_ASPAV|nr:hypothetical protein BDV25DRAFT_143651 [Aspergillus avenaceus]
MSMRQAKTWVLDGQTGPERLKFEDVTIPELGENDILVKMRATSLNFRDLNIVKGSYRNATKERLTPGSDGAGIVESVGPKVTAFTPGDKVVTYFVKGYSDTEPLTFAAIYKNGVGTSVDGSLREYGVFHESTLMHMPNQLSFLEASTLTCSGLTAWNALFGLAGLTPKPGDFVLVQGSGGVSIAALQFAVAAGASVIATTSSNEKAEKLKLLGASHVVNYKKIPDWGVAVKNLTPDQKGAHFVVDVGGVSTIGQSVKAIRPMGVLSITGVLGNNSDEQVPNIMDCLTYNCVARGVLVGTREQFRAMTHFIEDKAIKPVIDERVFHLEELKEAFEYIGSQLHFSKVCIEIS